MAIIVKAIHENLKIMNGPARHPLFSPDPATASSAAAGMISASALKRASLLLGLNHRKPKTLSSSQSSKLSLGPDLASSLPLPVLQASQASDQKSTTDMQKIAAERDRVSKMMAEGWEKRRTEASLDVEVRKYLLKHRESRS